MARNPPMKSPSAKLGVKMREQSRRIKELEAALKPFADFAATLDEQDDVNGVRGELYFGSIDRPTRAIGISVDDCITAAKVLKKDKPDA